MPTFYVKEELGVERIIIELRREHPNWGKKRIAQWVWKETYVCGIRLTITKKS
ncbi:MAG: hypothetical protein WAV32_02160 [Halobacteriota archaeon]